MKKIIAKFPVIILGFAVVIMALMACARPAYATSHYSEAVITGNGRWYDRNGLEIRDYPSADELNYPVVFATTDEINAKGFKFKKNTMYVEVCTGVVKNKKGDGYVVGHKDWYISYKYKGHQKKGKKVISFFPLDNNADHEALCRYDFIKKKDDWKLIYISS